MDIKQIGLIERIFKPRKNHQIRHQPTLNMSDQVNLSSSALNRFKDGADKRIKELVMKAPDVRIEKIREVKAKLTDDLYLKSISNEALADKMLRSPFGIQFKPQ